MTGSANKRIFRAFVGQQGSGKTYQLGEQVRHLRANPRISTTWIFDRLEEFDDVALSARSIGQWHEQVSEKNAYPRATAWQLGLEPDAYVELLPLAVAIGDVAIVLDEAWTWLPSGKPMDATLARIVFAGRHLETEDGRSRPTHLVLATQYPRTVDPRVWAQVGEVFSSRLVGDRALGWVRDYYGSDKAEAVRAVEPKRWVKIFP